jgi:hypothetical protein
MKGFFGMGGAWKKRPSGPDACPEERPQWTAASFLESCCATHGQTDLVYVEVFSSGPPTTPPKGGCPSGPSAAHLRDFRSSAFGLRYSIAPGGPGKPGLSDCEYLRRLRRPVLRRFSR